MVESKLNGNQMRPLLLLAASLLLSSCSTIGDTGPVDVHPISTDGLRVLAEGALTKQEITYYQSQGLGLLERA